MTASAAEKIVIDDEVLGAQQQSLQHNGSQIGAAVGPAKAQLGGTAFGVMNAFLVAPINHFAKRTAEAAAGAAELASGMEAGVAGARATFAAHEEDAAKSFAEYEVEA